MRLLQILKSHQRKLLQKVEEVQKSAPAAKDGDAGVDWVKKSISWPQQQVQQHSITLQPSKIFYRCQAWKRNSACNLGAIYLPNDRANSVSLSPCTGNNGHTFVKFSIIQHLLYLYRVCLFRAKFLGFSINRLSTRKLQLIKKFELD